MLLRIGEDDDLADVLEKLPETYSLKEGQQLSPIYLRLRFVYRMPDEMEPPYPKPTHVHCPTTAAVLGLLNICPYLDLTGVNRIHSQAEWGRVFVLEISW